VLNRRPEIPSDIEDFRDQRWRREGARQVSTAIEAERFIEQSSNGMMFGPDGRLYAGATRSRQIVAYDASGKTELIAQDVAVNDLAVTVKGDLYFTDSAAKKVWYVPKGGTPRVVDEGIEYPNGVMFSPDQTLLYVSDHAAQLSWAFQIQPDGSLGHKQKYFYVHMPDAASRSSADRL
jgi:hypothetical protein